MTNQDTTLATPFVIGQTYWLPRTVPQEITVLCPVCYGHKTITVTLGNGEHVAVECDGCGLGYEGPRGVVREYTYEANVRPFIIASVQSMHGDSWSVISTEGEQASWASLYLTEASAWDVSRAQLDKTVEENTRRWSTSNRKMLSRVAWTVAYHEKCIRDLEQKIAYHRSKVSAMVKP